MHKLLPHQLLYYSQLACLLFHWDYDSPDSSLLAFLSWFPLSAPFAAIIRLPSDPPLWELLLSSSVLALTAFGVMLLAERIFRFGVLSGSGVKGSLNWIKNKILRRKTF
jgi:ABC-2 type transport system permease protein